MSSSTFRTIPISSQRLSQNSSDQELVCEQWKILQSSMEIDKAVHAFLTQKLDDCGQTIAFEAFQLVQQKLNPKGFVRKAHKNPYTSLGSAITQPESPWSQAGLDLQISGTGIILGVVVKIGGNLLTTKCRCHGIS
jgi:hypothetical protein